MLLLSQSLSILTILFCLGLFLQLCCCCYLTKLLFRDFLQFKLSNFIGHSLKPCHHLFNVKFPLVFLLWKFLINLSLVTFARNKLPNLRLARTQTNFSEHANKSGHYSFLARPTPLHPKGLMKPFTKSFTRKT